MCNLILEFRNMKFYFVVDIYIMDLVDLGANGFGLDLNVKGLDLIDMDQVQSIYRPTFSLLISKAFEPKTEYFYFP